MALTRNYTMTNRQNGTRGKAGLSAPGDGRRGSGRQIRFDAGGKSMYNLGFSAIPGSIVGAEKKFFSIH